jgi:hypothetical protein
MIPDRAKQEVEALTQRGRNIELVEANGQCYAMVAGIEAHAPPWGAERFDILIVIPALYSEASLDGFYIGLPYTFNDGTHERIKNGAVIEVRGRKWQQVSWHYLDGKPWRQSLDSLETHIVHCRGFFLARGVKP